MEEHDTTNSGSKKSEFLDLWMDQLEETTRQGKVAIFYQRFRKILIEFQEKSSLLIWRIFFVGFTLLEFKTLIKATSRVTATTRSGAWNWAVGDSRKAEEGEQGPFEEWRRPEHLGPELSPVLCLTTQLLPLFANLPVTATHLTQCWVTCWVRI